MMFIVFWAVVVLILFYAAFLIWIRRGFQRLEPETHQAVTPPVSIVVAALFLEEMAYEQRWSEAVGKSPKELAKLADEAISEFRSGQTRPLRFDD